MQSENDYTTTAAGRFAPSPTGRMHLGNLFTALLSWLSVRQRGGRWVLRIEDLDPQRSKQAFAEQIEDDLLWLGLQWDEGGLDNIGPNGPYRQSMRHGFYCKALDRLRKTGLTYPCFCTRSDIMATQAPHQSDGRVIYQGTCRPTSLPHHIAEPTSPHATRLYVPDEQITFTDTIFGSQTTNLTHECGDFILRRADGAWAYQLAVVIDDASMGITEVVRGNDLLLSTAQQIYLYRLLGLPIPRFAHLPLICNLSMQRLSKRDNSMSMSHLRQHYTPEEIIGCLAYMAGLIPSPTPCRANELIDKFNWSSIPATASIPVPSDLSAIGSNQITHIKIPHQHN